MADDKSQEEKTEQPTPRKLEDARKKGQVARSQELNSVIIIITGMMALLFFSSNIMSNLIGAFHFNFDKIGIDVTMTNFYNLFIDNGITVVKILAPILILLGTTALLINIAQVGINFSFEAISPKFEKLDVIKGLKKKFSTKTLFNLVRDVLKVCVIAYITYLTYNSEMKNYIPLADQEVGQIFSFAGKVAVKILLRASGVLLLLAILDYAYQKYDFIKGLKMTKQEIKDEMKRHEGDPLIKMRIKRIQREMSQARMIKEVETADVVVTNPSHVAVALKYDTETMPAPVVIAKGERLMAEKIKEIAKAASVPIVENKLLARTLFEMVDVGMAIPAKLYRAVAEVLAYVYKLKGKI